MPHGLPEILSYGILFVFSLGLVFHWSRRAFRHPVPAEAFRGEVENGKTMFDKPQRLFHWSTTVAYILVVVTGVALYDPVAFEPITNALSIPLHGSFPTYVFWHVVGSSALAILLVIHIAWDVGKLKGFRLMWPGRADIREQIIRAKGLLSGSKDIPRTNKYDNFMKFFHLTLTIAILALAATGIYQLLFAAWWTVPIELHFDVEPFWRPTIIHDFFGFTLIALVIGHTYFALLPINRPILGAMVKGRLSAEEIKKRYKPGAFMKKVESETQEE